MIRSSKKTLKRRRMIWELDRDARERVFARDGCVCVRCHNKTRPVQWAHIFSRRHKNLRWEEDNALTLCAGCHLWWHHEPVLAVDWFKKNWGDRYDRLMAVIQVNPKVNVKELHEELMADPPEVPIEHDPKACDDLAF